MATVGRFNVLEPWPEMPGLTLDASQLAAMRHALTNEVTRAGRVVKLAGTHEAHTKRPTPLFWLWSFGCTNWLPFYITHS